MPPIIVIAGQSNAAGRGSVETIPNYAALGYHLPFPAVQYLYKTEDEPTDPLAWDLEYGPDDLVPMPGGNAGILGVELSLGRTLIARGIPHAIAKMAIGSSLLHTHWKAVGSTYPTDPPHLFDQLVTFCGDAETALSGEIAELIWIQGESDAGNAAAAPAYAANFRAFIETFRATFPGVPVTINRLHSQAGGSFNSTVRAQQDLISATIPGVRIFGVDDLPLIGAHFTAPGYVTLGERFADALTGVSSGFGLRSGIRSGLVSGLRTLGASSSPAMGDNFPPIAEFSFEDTGLSVDFTDESEDLEGAIASWLWNFGDGAISTSQNPTHVFAADGTYSVRLTVTDGDGATANVTHEIEVEAALWSIDATSSKAVPADATEWAAFLAANPSLAFSVPDRLWLFQDASGNLASSIGGKTLTMTGSPLYQQTETGWERKFIKSNTASGANRFADNGTMVAATTSVLLLGFARIVQPVQGHQRMFYGSASNNAFEGLAGSPNIRYRTGANAANGSLSHVGQVRPYVILHDETNNRHALFSDIEKVSPAFAARSGTTVRFTFSLSTDATSDTAFGYAVAWEGAAAERSDAEIKALLQAMGWAVSGY